MANTRIIPSPAIANQSVPIFSLPSITVRSPSDLGIMRVYFNGTTLTNPGTITDNDSVLGFPDQKIYSLRVQNDFERVATIQSLEVSGDIELFTIDPDLIGGTLNQTESYNFTVKTLVGEELGVVDRLGTITITSTYQDQAGTQTNIVNILYRTLRIGDDVLLTQPPEEKDGRLRPDSYTDEFGINLNRTREFTKSPRKPGLDSKS